MKKYTDITLLIDRSGSMSSCEKEMVSGIAEFLKTHKAVPSTRVTVIQFDNQDDQEYTVTDTPVSDVGSIRLVPRGMTPLNDAFYKAIEGTGARLSRLDSDTRPDQVLFVVITDGLENASKKYSRADVLKAVTDQTNTYGWQFVYLGANQDAIKEGAKLGVPKANSSTFTGDNANVAWTDTANNTLSYSNRTSAFIPDYTDDQRKRMVQPKPKRS